jgi:hypothetical protein
MAIAKWQPGHLYIPGALVIPTTIAGATPTVIPNADFEGGDTDWTKGTGWAINSNGFFSGAIGAEYSGPGAADLVSSTKHAIAPGKSITAQCFISQGASDDDQANAAVILRWYDSGDVFISDSTGNSVSSGEAGVWRKSSVSGIAPPLAAKVSVGCSAYNDWAALYADDFSWNYVTGAAAAALAYKSIGKTTGPRTDIAFVDSNPDTITRLTGSFIDDGFVAGDNVTIEGSATNQGVVPIIAVDALTLYPIESQGVTPEAAGPTITITTTGNAGTSGSSEPTWPTSIGATVIDGTVVWETVSVDSVTWEASSVLTSGSSEPTWPLGTGDYVSDNNIAWETTPLRIEDENCPHTKVVAIAASKVFAGDTDIVRFCATLNARDWSSEDDAGFLPTGLQQKSQVGVTAMGVYRGNLAVWSPSTFQVWQVDPDPAAMALLDAMEGIGSMSQQAVQPVSDDLFFHAALGVRTVSIAEGSNNLASGDVGVPIDILVQAEANAVDVEPVASYYPSGGQYWLAFRPRTILAALLAGQFLLTSPPYPIEGIDGMGFSISMQSGSMFGTNEEAMDTTASAGDGTIDKQLVTALMPDEGLGFTIAMISGDMEDA